MNIYTSTAHALTNKDASIRHSTICDTRSLRSYVAAAHAARLGCGLRTLALGYCFPDFYPFIHLDLLFFTSNKNFILKYFRCRDGKRAETRNGMEGICITHSCIPLYTVYMQHIMAHSGGMQEWVIQIPSIPFLVSALFPSLHLKYFRIKFLLLVCIVFMRMRTKPHPHPVIS